VDITSFPFPSKLIEAEDDTVIALVATSVEQFDELALRDLTSWSWTTSGKYIGLAIVVNGKTMPLVRFDTRLAHHREALQGALREGSSGSSLRRTSRLTVNSFRVASGLIYRPSTA
jgi:hypothetical protein